MAWNFPNYTPPVPHVSNGPSVPHPATPPVGPGPGAPSPWADAMQNYQPRVPRPMGMGHGMHQAPDPTQPQPPIPEPNPQVPGGPNTMFPPNGNWPHWPPMPPGTASPKGQWFQKTPEQRQAVLDQIRTNLPGFMQGLFGMGQ